VSPVILSDSELRAYILGGRLGVEPLDPELVRENGVDLRIGGQYCLISGGARVVDVNVDSPAQLDGVYRCGEAEELVLAPSARYLLHTLEYIRVPPELMGFVELRSTFARLGFLMPPTIVDGGFEGQLTIEVATPPFPVKLRAGTRFLHVVFARLSSPAVRPYRGRYQGQRGVTLPKLPP